MILFNLLITYSVIDILAGLFCFIFGTAIGSFINVVVDRLIHNQSLEGRSKCDYCKKTLAWNDLIPIISYFMIKGKCRYCKHLLSVQYPLVEFGTGILFVITWLLIPGGSTLLHLVLYWGIVSSFWVIFLSDMKYHLISDYMQIAAFVFILLVKIIQGATIFSLLLDCISGISVLIPIALIYFISKKRAMGEGDVILAFLIGFFLGIGRGLIALYLAFITGAILGSFLLVLHKKKLKSEIAFGPFLIIGMIGSAFWGTHIILFIRQMYGF